MINKVINKQTLGELGRFLATGGVKMFLEAPYNELFKTEFGQRLKRLGITSQAGIVSALGLFTFFLQRKLPTDTAFRSVVKEVVADSWPEISKRLFNGFTDFLVSHSANASGEEKAVVDKLKQAKPEDLEDLASGLLVRDIQDVKSRDSALQGPASLDRLTEKIRGSRKKLQEKRKRSVLW